MASGTRFGLCLVLTAAMVSGFPSGAHAQDDDEPEGMFDAWAESVAASLAPRWGGPRVDWPRMRPRPEAAGVIRSSFHPVAVHTAANVQPDVAAASLAALETAHGWMERNGWPTAHPDGGYGDTAAFDLYFVSDVLETPADGVARWLWTSYDVPLSYGGLDAVTPFAAVDSGVAPSRITPCVISAYVQASLLGHDPAEARSWRVATGNYVAWLITGHFGCDEAGVVGAQRETRRTWIGRESGEGGALFLAMLSARTDGLTGDFIRDLWSGASQLTWEGTRLRAAPDMWQVVFTVMQVGEDPLERLLEEMGVARYFCGDPDRLWGSPLALLGELPADAVVPIAGRIGFDDLPRRFEPHGLELEAYGSAYLEIDTSDTTAGDQLRIWLRGEFGVGWSLTAVRIGEDGRERGRVRAPVRTTTPRSYIPLELTDDETERVVVVVTNVGHRLLDADEADDQVRAFRLILDSGTSADDTGTEEPE